MTPLPEKIAVMAAAERGEPIRATDRTTGEKTDVLDNPKWNWDDYDYEVAPPPMKKLKFLAWICPNYGLRWLPESEVVTNSHYKRVPGEDKEIEVEE